MTLIEDIRFGFRMMAKSPAFTLTAVVAIALGIGVNAAVFAIGNGAINAAPVVNDRILYLGRSVSLPDLLDWSARSKTFAFIIAPINVKDKSAGPAGYNLSQITANTFSLIGYKPVIGRDFTFNDEKDRAAPVTRIDSTRTRTSLGKPSKWMASRPRSSA